MHRISPLMGFAIVGLMLASSLLLWGGVASAPHALGAPLDRPAAAHPLAATTHGDIVVGPANSPYVLSPSIVGSTTFEEQGNITVLPGGKLYVDNLDVAFLQFIGESGSAGVRAAHLYNFTVQGLAVFNGSTLTTDAGVLNAFTKLSVNVDHGGTLVAESSRFAFPGWITVNGSGSQFFANGSVLTQNPAIANLTENRSLQLDAESSPALTVTNGAEATILGSRWNDLYADNQTANGVPGLNLSSAAGGNLSLGNSFVWTNLQFPRGLPTPEGIAEALGYPSYAGATLTIAYQGVAAATFGAGSQFTFDGVNYSFPYNLVLPGSPGNQTFTASIPAPSALLRAVDTAGIVGTLQSTGMFGGPSLLNVTVHMSAGIARVLLVGMSLQFVPTYPYNMVVNGARITIADSTIGLNWNALPGTPVDQGVPTPEPWRSNKLLLENGSSAFLANVSTPAGYNTVFDNASVVIPEDAASAAYFYRWGEVEAFSGAFGPIPNVHVTYYSAFNASQSNNATVTSLNALATADPALANYSASLARAGGYTDSVTGVSGFARTLLVSTEVTSDTLPTGTFLGAYHILSVLPGGGANASTWHYGTVSAYPLNMSPAAADLLPSALYPNYRAELAIGSVDVAITNESSTPQEGSPLVNPTVALGQNVTFTFPVTNVGSASLVNFTVSLGYTADAGAKVTALGKPLGFSVLAPGTTQNVTFSWIVNASVANETLLKRFHAYSADFVLNATWNGGRAPTGGSAVDLFPATFVPAYITLVFDPPTGGLSVGPPYNASGTLAFYGSGEALVNITAIGPGGPFLLSQVQQSAGPLTAPFVLPPGIQPGTQYALVVSASYGGRTVYDNSTTILTAGAAPPGPSLLSTLYGPLPLWLWLVIAIAVVAGLLGFFFLTGRLAQGKLVECGECGNLIPETATTCPKCGAEFETDLVRCSRCASTIPANSAICPECSAQLLGAPSDAKDPERQGYADFIERYRAEARKELQENYNEGAFWDWWKRQPTYVPFGKWQAQQSASSRAGMTAPIVGETGASVPPPERRPPKGGASAAPRAASTPPPAAPTTGTAPDEADAPASGVVACPNCGKEVPSDFLVCPFCSAVTR
jgi:RNA polymerase subunit RPABC4/transcription elongation factor Spt4